MEDYLTQITNYLLTQSWQIAVLVVVIAAVTLALKNRSAHIRYLLWLIVLAKCLVPPLLDIPLPILSQDKTPELTLISNVEMPAANVEMTDTVTSEPIALPSLEVTSPTIMERLARVTARQWLGFGWIVGVAAFLLFALVKALRTNFWLWRQRKLLPAELQSGIKDLFSGLGIKTFPKVWLVEGIGQPFVWGLLRGSIYLPADFVKVNSEEHRRGILSHELSHILRYDAAVNILQIIAQAVFWFHPFVWWANKKIRAEREKCCDEMAIARLGTKVKDYSSAIVNILISEHESTRPVPSLAVAGPVKNIEERIKTMLRPGKKFYKRPSLVAATVVLLLALLTVPTALVLTAHAAEEWRKPKSGTKVSCYGRVVNTKGEPVADARVRLLTYYDARLVKEMITKADGAFYFAIDADRFKEIDPAAVVAEKEGLAIGWANWQTYNTLRNLYQQIEIKLGEAKELTGVVVDEGSQPIVWAEVSICRLRILEGWDHRFMDDLAQELLKVKTDRSGKFTFTNLPVEATVELLVKKAGKATVYTLGDLENYTWVDTFEFRPGQEDITIEMPVEATIDGIVVEKSSGKPAAGVKLMVRKKGLRGRRNWLILGQEPVISREDGGFHINALVDGRYSLQVAQANDKTVDWVGEPVEVVLDQGESKSDVRIEVSKDAGQKAVVTDSADKKPPVSLSRITGVVRDEIGKPVGHIPIQIFPWRAFGPHFRTDAEGKFEVRWDPRNRMRRKESCYLIFRDEQRNLAAAVEIYEDTKTLDVKLKPGVMLTGKIVDANGRGIANAWFRVENMPGGRVPASLGWPLWGQTKADQKGNFEIKGLIPGHKYRINARADGYRAKRVKVDTSDAVNNRLELDPVILPVPNLSVSGMVVDVDGKPVGSASVVAFNTLGQGDASHICTDAEGKFRLEKVCAGWVDLQAFVIGKTYLEGRVNAEAGATEVKIVVTKDTRATTRYVPKQPPSLLGKPLPELKDLKVELSPSDASNKMILVCFFDMEQRPSRYLVMELAKQVGQLKEKGITVVAVQASKVDERALNEWVQKYSIPFTVGMIQGDVEKTKFAWGVRALPWLILTDRNHVISAEGFELDELYKKIEAVAEK